MDGPALDLATYGHALAAVGYTLLASLLLRERLTRPIHGALHGWFVAAVATTAAWAAVTAFEPHARTTAPAFAAAALDIGRYGLWYVLLLRLLRPAGGPQREPRALAPLAMAATALAAAALAWRALHGQYEADASRAFVAAMLALPLLGLVLIEQLFRNLAEDSRWNAKPLCLALAVAFVFDLYLFSEAMLFRRFDRDAVAIRGVIHLLAVPLLVLASRRRGDWIRGMQVSRSAAFYSATLLLTGGYLLLMAGIGYYVSYFGGAWGRALQLGLLVAALALLALLFFSGSMRAWLRVFLAKHFFSYRYDYRAEWLRFTAMLSTKGSPQEVGNSVLRGLANLVESPAGSLWLRFGNEHDYRQTAQWNVPPTEAREPAGGELSTFLRDRGWVIDVDEWRQTPRRYGTLSLPPWLTGNPTVWLVAPLLVGDGLLGFVTLARSRTALELNWEIRDLLKTASRQAAAFLAHVHATDALLEARKFDAFNKMSAFVVHDLKNIVTQLALMLKNAERHHGNPEFQQDMLLTVGSSLEKMRRLMLQLREGAAPPGGARGVELAPILARIQSAARSRGRGVEVASDEGLATRGHDERLERVLGHFVDNALDATPEDGRVWARATRYSGQVRVEVGDTGAGMTEEFVKSQLFRPFITTKRNGMGIGAYESSQYVKELGGSIDVDSAPGRGTVVVLHLPLFDGQAQPALHAAAQP